MKLSPNFDSKEFECPCCKKSVMDLAFINRLQSLRTAWNKPLKINSGYRCDKHNKAVGGVPTSQHLLGIAADLDISALSGEEKYKLIALAFNLGFKGIGIAKSFLHLDTRKDNFSTWTY